MAFRTGDPMPMLADFTAFGVDFTDGRRLTPAEHTDALAQFRVLYAGHVAETNADMEPNRECELDECTISESDLQAWTDARLADPDNTPEDFQRWLRRSGRGFRKTNLGLAQFTFWGFQDSALVGYVHADNVRVERTESRRVEISTRMFTVWAPGQVLTRVQRDARMQRWLLEHDIFTPYVRGVRTPIDIVEIRHYRGPGIGINVNRHSAYTTEFWPEFNDFADEIKEPADEQVEALRRQSAPTRPPADPDISPGS